MANLILAIFAAWIFAALVFGFFAALGMRSADATREEAVIEAFFLRLGKTGAVRRLAIDPAQAFATLEANPSGYLF